MNFFGRRLMLVIAFVFLVAACGNRGVGSNGTSATTSASSGVKVFVWVTDRPESPAVDNALRSLFPSAPGSKHADGVRAAIRTPASDGLIVTLDRDDSSLIVSVLRVVSAFVQIRCVSFESGADLDFVVPPQGPDNLTVPTEQHLPGSTTIGTWAVCEA